MSIYPIVKSYTNSEGCLVIDIKERSGHDLKYYAISIIINQSSGDIYNLIKNNINNIYVIDEDNNLLYYWINKKIISNENIEIWINIPYLSAYGEKTIMLCWSHNADPIYRAYNNPEKVFLFYDNFSKDPNNNGKWIIIRNSNDTNTECAWDPIEQRLYLTKDEKFRACMALMNVDLPDDFAIKFRAGAGGEQDIGADGWAFSFFREKENFTNTGSVIAGGWLGIFPGFGGDIISGSYKIYEDPGYAIEFDSFKNLILWNDPSENHIALLDLYKTLYPGKHIYFINSTVVRDNKTHDIEIIVYNNNIIVSIDGNILLNTTYHLNKKFKSGGFSAATGSKVDNHWLEDYVALRPYVYPEPAITLVQSCYKSPETAGNTITITKTETRTETLYTTIYKTKEIISTITTTPNIIETNIGKILLFLIILMVFALIIVTRR